MQRSGLQVEDEVACRCPVASRCVPAGSGAARSSVSGPVPQYALVTSTAGMSERGPWSGTPRMPTTPSAKVQHAPATGAGVSTATGKSIVHSGAGSIRGNAPSARRRSCSLRSRRKAAGPPPSRSTPAGTPSGSTPTDTARAWSPIARRCASLPGTPPSDPNSSPTTRTRPDVMPSSDHAAAIAVTASPLSVSPISMCLASLVMRGSRRPARRAHASAIATAAGNVCTSVAAIRAWTATTSSAIAAFGGSRHSGSGIRSILRRFTRLETTAVCRPRAASAVCVSCAARSRAASSCGVATCRSTSPGPCSLSRYSSDPRLQATRMEPGPRGRACSCASTCSSEVPVTMARSHAWAESDSSKLRSSVASSVRAAIAVPSQSKSTASKRCCSMESLAVGLAVVTAESYPGNGAPRPRSGRSTRSQSHGRGRVERCSARQGGWRGPAGFGGRVRCRWPGS